MAPIGLKLCQNAFQTIPDISFFDAGHKFFFAFFANFEDPFTPRGWLRLAWNFGKTRFRWSPTFHFSTPKKICSTKLLVNKNFAHPPQPWKSANCLFWRSCEFSDVTSRCASKIHCPNYRFQPSTTLGGGVKKAVSVFGVTFGQKKLAPSSDDIRRYSTIFDDTYKNEALRNIEETLRNIKVSINPLRNIKEPPTWNRPPTGH